MTVQQSSATHRPLSLGRAILAAALLGLLALSLPAAAQAAAPSWDISINAIGGDGGVYFAPGAQGTPAEGPGYLIKATNTGTAPTSGTYTITDTLPAGVTVAPGTSAEDQNGNALSCAGTLLVITCSGTVPVGLAEEVDMTLPVNIDENAVTTNEKSVYANNKAVVQGGGAASSATAFLKTYLTGGRPAWASFLSANPANLLPASSYWAQFNQFYLDVANVGGGASSGPITVVFTLSPGLTPKVGGSPEYPFPYLFIEEVGRVACTVPTPNEVSCTSPGSVEPGELMIADVPVDTTGLSEGETTSALVTITGGSAPNAQVSTTAEIKEENAPFNYLPGSTGLSAALTGPDGLPATQAGSHPGTLSVQLGFPSRKANGGGGAGEFTASDGGVRDAKAYLPPGVIVNPLASPELCPEAQMEQDACPRGTAVGLTDLQTMFFGPTSSQSPLYNIVTPPGRPASFSFDAVGIGIYPHILGGIREGGNYAISAVSNDVLGLFGFPFLGLRTEFWGNPSDPVYDEIRGECDFSGYSHCTVPQQPKPLVTLPTYCSGELAVDSNIDSWGSPGVFHHRDGLVIDSSGNPTSITGCNALEFSPSLEARPTTNVADSPSGLDIDLEVPQTDAFNTLATAHLRKAVVTLPEGFVINPSGANGVRGCTSAQVGIDPQTAIPDGNPTTCPEAARLGTAEVNTTLLDHPMPGSIYLAEPYDNPFDALLAIYVVVNDEQSGTLIKLPAEIEADPNTGQLTTTFDENPQLPFTDFKLDFFGGALAPLRTPSICSSQYKTTSSITPWSAPESGPPATPSDTYAINQSPGSQTCAKAGGEEPNTPSFDAGAISPIAGASSPLVVNLRRPDGSQQFSSITVSPPPGLIGKLAGVPYCPQAALDAAAVKTGKEELASPSCPVASRVGVVNIGAGAGPAPYYTQGTVFLTGPYKGAPLSLAVVTPVVAGAYDLGTVVTRIALQIDPDTAKITAVSDSLPTILKGIPLDIRSIQVKLDRPDFTLNPTSCDALQFTGQLVSVFGTPASLQSRFQLGECVNLGFKPSLSLRMKGATKRTKNPSLIATYKARPGDANLARAQVKLPPAAFLDNGHIGTVCTRVQFAADQCPADSIYGHAEATSPIVDYTVSGPVYLRSNPEHELPDLVAALNGPASQPIEIDLAGKTDAVKSALRNTFEAVPDVPVSTFKLELLGGSKGLIELSRNLCKGKYRAEVQLESQNGLVSDSSPVVQSDCKGKPKPNHHRHHHRHGN